MVSNSTTSQVNRRSKLETYCDILRAISSGAGKPTHILYKANLSWTVLQNCLNTLETQGLIEVMDDDGRKAFRLSDRGFKLVEQYLSLSEGLNLSQRE